MSLQLSTIVLARSELLYCFTNLMPLSATLPQPPPSHLPFFNHQILLRRRE